MLRCHVPIGLTARVFPPLRSMSSQRGRTHQRRRRKLRTILTLPAKVSACPMLEPSQATPTRFVLCVRTVMSSHLLQCGLVYIDCCAVGNLWKEINQSRMSPLLSSLVRAVPRTSRTHTSCTLPAFRDSGPWGQQLRSAGLYRERRDANTAVSSVKRA